MKLSKLFTIGTLIVSSALLTPSSAMAQTPTTATEIKAEQVVESVTTLVDLNTATSEQLASLPGLGKKKAEAIINYRQLNGNFTQKEEIVNVKGIGSKLLSKLSPLITVSKPE